MVNLYIQGAQKLKQGIFSAVYRVETRTPALELLEAILCVTRFEFDFDCLAALNVAGGVHYYYICGTESRHHASYKALLFIFDLSILKDASFHNSAARMQQ